MTLHVTSDSFLSDVQEQFQNSFPDFKIEFFFTSSDKIVPASTLHHSFPFVRIKELNTICKKTSLIIKDSMTISDLEKKFRRKFGLPARIYQRVGKYWQKKASMDNCRLGEHTDSSQSLYYIHSKAKRIETGFALQMGG